MIEKWKDIPGYEGHYQASNLGQIRSLDRLDCAGKKQRGRILSLIVGYKGYASVGLSKDGKVKCFRVHTLVCSSWLGKCPPGNQVLHGELGKSCNSVHNLNYGTAKQNQIDRIRDGTRQGTPVRRGDGLEFDTITEAAISVSCCRNRLSDVCKGRLKSAGDHTWSYVEKK